MRSFSTKAQPIRPVMQQPAPVVVAPGPVAPPPPFVEALAPTPAPIAAEAAAPAFADVPAEGRPISNFLEVGTYKLKGGGTLRIDEGRVTLDLYDSSGGADRKDAGQIRLRSGTQEVLIAFGVATDGGEESQPEKEEVIDAAAEVDEAAPKPTEEP